ncbi:MAG TPA: lysophospholipase [Kofleriaceae bacterium]|nr:lysophospholipase [Kofleriaceae bacterium]
MMRTVLLPLLVILAACAPRDPGLRLEGPRPAVPDGVERLDTTFRGDGVELYAQRWRPTGGVEPRAVVVIHHGLADHSGRYSELAVQLVQRGYAVWALDMRGHGRSAGPRISFDSIDVMLDDLDAFLRLVREQEPGRPLFLYGHSFGGLIACLYAIERQPQLAGLVLAAPALAFDAPPVQAGAIAVFGVIARNLPAVPPDHAGFSRRAEIVREMNSDPLIEQGKGPARTARAATDGAERVWAAAERMRVPLLVEHGTADRLTAPSGSRDLVARAGSSDKTLRIHDGLFHDLLREPDGAGERVTGEIIAWIEAHSGGAPVTFTSSQPTGALRGDQHGRAVSIELDVRGEQPRADGAPTAFTGGMRSRIGVGRGALGAGYVGGLDVRGGRLDGGYYHVDAHALGIALRGARGALLSITGGIGIGGVRGADATRAPLEVSLEMPVGPTRVFARAGLAWRLGGDDYVDDALGVADEASALVGGRFGRDRRYWGSVVAGGGPFLALTYQNLGGAELYGVSLGLDLWGGN